MRGCYHAGRVNAMDVQETFVCDKAVAVMKERLRHLVTFLRMGSLPVVTSGVLSVLCSGCESECPPPAQTYALTKAFEEHACTHVAAGPFETLAAGPDFKDGDVQLGTLPELRNTHVAYTVEFPANQTARGAVMFKPRETGAYAWFTRDDEPLALHTADARICPVAVHKVTACTGLRQVAYFELQRKVEYGVSLSAPPQTRLFVIERSEGQGTNP